MLHYGNIIKANICRPVAGVGQGGGGGLEPPQNFWKLKNNVPKNDNLSRLMCTDQSALNSDAAGAFFTTFNNLFTTCQFLSPLNSLFLYTAATKAPLPCESEIRGPKWIEINQSQTVKAVEINYLFFKTSAH